MTDIRWLAGWLEGEGSFYARHSRSRPGCIYPALRAVSTDLDVIKRAACYLKAKVYGPYRYGTNKKPHWQIHMHGAGAVNMMRRLRPYMGKRRRRQIDKVIASV